VPVAASGLIDVANELLEKAQQKQAVDDKAWAYGVLGVRMPVSSRKRGL